MEQSTLHNLFGDQWGEDQPASLIELMAADYDTLDEKARSLRALAVKLVHSFERKPVHTAGIARQMLEDHHLPARKGKWCAVALDAENERIYNRAEGGGMRLNHTVSLKFFTLEKLKQRAPLPEDGKYLIIYGGGPEVLASESTASEISKLRNETRIADVIFWDVSGEAAVFYSLGVGVGQKGRELLDFPDPALLEKARN